jgi:hypothetical protein
VDAPRDVRHPPPLRRQRHDARPRRLAWPP